MRHVAIAGAGVMGLATALELADRGYRVTVLERGKAMREASWAAAGMLAAEDPENPPALAAFSRFSLGLYPAFLARVERLSGMAVPFRTTQTLQIVDGIAASGLAESDDVLTHDEATRRVPGLHLLPGQGALWLEERSLDPRDLCRALASAVHAAGIELREDAPVLASQRTPRHHDGAVAITTPTGEVHADALVVTTGAWSGHAADRAAARTDLHTLPAGWVSPRKGQMLRVRLQEHAQTAGLTSVVLATVLRSPDIYIVPRGNGSLIVGATIEDAGYDRSIRQDATAWLLHEAAKLWWPMAGVTQEQVEEVWTGIRPATADALPILGPLEPGEPPSVLFATGHYRNGILLAPGTARIVGQLLSGDDAAIDLAPFDPRRMITPSDSDASNSCSHDKESSAAL